MLLLLVDTVTWAFLCRRLEHGISDAAAAAQIDGWSITSDATRWGGWPLTAAVDLRGATAAGSIVPGLAWHAESARVELAFLHPATLSIHIAPSQSLHAQAMPSIPFTAARTVIEADLTGATPVRATIADLKATLQGGDLALDRAEFAFPPEGLAADLHGLSLPGMATAIGVIHLRADIDPAPPRAATAQAGALAWRQAGGRIHISEAALHWDTLDAAGSGTITLDERLQPKADGSVRASGLPRLLDDLAHAGTLAPAQAGAAKAVIAILAAPTGGQSLQVPISFEDSVLRLARFPLLRLPPLAWN